MPKVIDCFQASRLTPGEQVNCSGGFLLFAAGDSLARFHRGILPMAVAENGRKKWTKVDT
jgi:hypothetical protein